MVVIEVDHRERPSGIHELVSNDPEIRVEVRTLAVGDYVVDGWVTIERKTTRDFVASLVSGRLLNQVASLRRNTTRPIVVIEGENLHATGHNVDSAAIRGALVSISTMWHVPILFSASSRDTALVLTTIARQTRKFDGTAWSGPLRRPKDADRRRATLLQCVPGIGPTLAWRMIERFKTIRNVINADAAQLQSVRGIGSDRAAAFVRFVDGSRSPHSHLTR